MEQKNEDEEEDEDDLVRALTASPPARSAAVIVASVAPMYHRKILSASRSPILFVILHLHVGVNFAGARWLTHVVVDQEIRSLRLGPFELRVPRAEEPMLVVERVDVLSHQRRQPCLCLDEGQPLLLESASILPVSRLLLLLARRAAQTEWVSPPCPLVASPGRVERVEDLDTASAKAIRRYAQFLVRVSVERVHQLIHLHRAAGRELERSRHPML